MTWNLVAVLGHISEMEGGYRALVYLDSAKKRTIGIGFNLDDPTAPETCRIHGLDWAGMVSGTVRITYSEAAAIATDQIMTARYHAKVMIPTFDDLPEKVQTVVLDMEFNLGSPRFSLFHDTIAAINDGDYALAAGCMRASEWYREVGYRGRVDCMMMAAA